jgi:hypothetical protein
MSTHRPKRLTTRADDFPRLSLFWGADVAHLVAQRFNSRMRRFWPLLVAFSYVVVAACVGDDPASNNSGTADDGGGADGTVGPGSGSSGADGTVGPVGDSSVGDGSAGETGADAAPGCGYPGEDCCAAPALPCTTGTVCSTSNDKCMISELGVVGDYAEIRSGPTFTKHIASAFYDGVSWTMGPDVMTEAGFGSYSTTDLISSSPGNYHVTLFASTQGKMFNFYSSLWRKCEPGQACVGPTLPPPAFWSVAKISNDTWIGATNAIYRCVPGSSCTNQVTGLESTNWGTGKLVGTGSQDIWYSALTRAFHYDGTKWTIHDGIKARTIFQLRKDDVWVGDQTLQHYDGTSWSTEYAIDGAPAPGIITSISGSSDKDIWAVGYNASDGTHPVFTAHWDGTAWHLVPVPPNTTDESSVYAPSPLEAYMACKSGVYRWDGTQWKQMTIPTVDAGAGGQPEWTYIAGPARPRP